MQAILKAPTRRHCSALRWRAAVSSPHQPALGSQPCDTKHTTALVMIGMTARQHTSTDFATATRMSVDAVAVDAAFARMSSQLTALPVSLLFRMGSSGSASSCRIVTSCGSVHENDADALTIPSSTPHNAFSTCSTAPEHRTASAATQQSVTMRLPSPQAQWE